MKKSTGKRVVPVCPPIVPNIIKTTTLQNNASVSPAFFNTENDYNLTDKQNSVTDLYTNVEIKTGNNSDDTDKTVIDDHIPQKELPPWLHSRMDRNTVEKLLTPRTDGFFLIRESTIFDGDYTMSLCHEGNIIHYRIKRRRYWFTIDDEEVFDNLEELVEHYTNDADGLVTKLGKYVPYVNNDF